MRVENPEVDLQQLFEDLAGGSRVRRDPLIEPRIAEELRGRLETAEFAATIGRKWKFTVPVRGEELEADYAFQNGCLNLIQAHEFNHQRTADVLKDTTRIAVEGHLLFKHPDPVDGERRLVIVGEFGPAAQDEQKKITAMLRDHEVELYSSETLDQLVGRIRATAH